MQCARHAPCASAPQSSSPMRAALQVLHSTGGEQAQADAGPAAIEGGHHRAAAFSIPQARHRSGLSTRRRMSLAAGCAGFLLFKKQTPHQRPVSAIGQAAAAAYQRGRADWTCWAALEKLMIPTTTRGAISGGSAASNTTWASCSRKTSNTMGMLREELGVNTGVLLEALTVRLSFHWRSVQHSSPLHGSVARPPSPSGAVLCMT